MSEEVKSKVLEKWKKSALEWHNRTRKQDFVPATPAEKADVSDTESIEQELRLVREIKRAVVDSPVERKDIYLTTLSGIEKELEKGETGSNLPDIVRNLAKKEVLRSRIVDLTKKYRIGATDYYYLWGIGND